MALGDTLNQVDDATKGVQDGADSQLSKKDPAKGDVQGNRKKNSAGETNDDDEIKPKDKDSSLRINIKLDLDVEVHLTARIKGDITIGLL